MNIEVKHGKERGRERIEEEGRKGQEGESSGKARDMRKECKFEIGWEVK